MIRTLQRAVSDMETADDQLEECRKASPPGFVRHVLTSFPCDAQLLCSHPVYWALFWLPKNANPHT